MITSVVLGIAGTAKNTGKTTALNALLEEAHVQRVPVAVTSIGYDGESIDNVTGLPKPRIVLQSGSIATTSRSCLPRSGWEILEETDWSTALGQVLIVRCIDAGPIVLAGPGTRRDLADIIDRMRGLGPSLILIDGALNRLAPMSAASALIIATGAARTDDLTALARETASIESICSLPASSKIAESSVIEIRTPFAAVADVIGAIQGHDGNDRRLIFRVPVSIDVMTRIAEGELGSSPTIEFVFPDPVMALLSADAVEMNRAIGALRDRGIRVTVEQPMTLAAVTVNPFLPRYRHQRYVADSVQALDLHRAVQSTVRTKVVDVVREGGIALWEALKPTLAGTVGL